MIKFKFNWVPHCPEGAKYTSGGCSPSWGGPAKPPVFKKPQNIEYRTPNVEVLTALFDVHQ
ncbi:MAG: hypothetical protein ACKOCO_11640, partial [Bacteroidota bacterium]